MSGNLQALWYCWAISLDLEPDDYKPMMNELDEAISDPDQAMDVDHPVSVEAFTETLKNVKKGIRKSKKALEAMDDDEPGFFGKLFG